MQVEVKVPVLPESITEATLVNWHKKAGEAVARDENLVDVETDKVVLELPAPAAGALLEIRKGDGSTVAGQEVIAPCACSSRLKAPTSTDRTSPFPEAARDAATPAACPVAIAGGISFVA